MVAFSDANDRIDGGWPSQRVLHMLMYSGFFAEFWRIRSLIGSTAIGVRGASYRKAPAVATQENDWSQSSLVSNASENGSRHLALVFFDILHLDGQSLLNEPYSQRRSLLESLIVQRYGYTMLARRVAIDMVNRERAEDGLRLAIAELKREFEEGAVVKADESRYNDPKLKWVKVSSDDVAR